MGEVEITHSFKEANNSDASSCETNMVNFKTLGQKKTMSATNPLVIAAPPIIQVPLPTVDPILELADVIMSVRPNSSEAPLLDKHKKKELTEGMSKRSKKRQGKQARHSSLPRLQTLSCGN